MTVVRRPAGVAVVTDGALDSEALAYAAPLPDGPITVLRGVTAVVYRVLLGGPADPRAAVANALGVDSAEIDETALADLIDDLVGRRLLVRSSD